MSLPLSRRSSPVLFSFLLFLLSLLPVAVWAQSVLSLRGDYVSSSRLTDEVGRNLGSGGLWRTTLRAVVPLSSALTDTAKVRPARSATWSLVFSGMYARLGAAGPVAPSYPGQIVNVSAGTAYQRPLFGAGRWRLMGSFGLGIYAPANRVGWQSLLVNGGVLMVYHVRKGLAVGGGLGLTTSYGLPMVVPMGYLSWNRSGPYELHVDLTNGLRVAGAARLTQRFRAELTAIEMGGFSAVMSRSRIYSSTLLSSTVSAHYAFTPHMGLNFGVGSVWRRTSRLTSRSVKSLFKSDGADKCHFGPAFQCTLGFQVRLR